MSEVRLIDANRLITELWNAMWKYEDKTEKRFMESDELDVGDWFSHRIFVQNMSDIDRDVVQKQPTVDAVPVEWMKAKIESLKSQDNEFLQFAAITMQAMLNCYGVEGERRSE